MPAVPPTPHSPTLGRWRGVVHVGSGNTPPGQSPQTLTLELKQGRSWAPRQVGAGGPGHSLSGVRGLSAPARG